VRPRRSKPYGDVYGAASSYADCVYCESQGNVVGQVAFYCPSCGAFIYHRGWWILAEQEDPYKFVRGYIGRCLECGGEGRIGYCSFICPSCGSWQKIGEGWIHTTPIGDPLIDVLMGDGGV